MLYVASDLCLLPSHDYTAHVSVSFSHHPLITQDEDHTHDYSGVEPITWNLQIVNPPKKTRQPLEFI